MSFFNLFKNKQIVWRDEDGKIRCLGEKCQFKICEESCPIWCMTKGLKILKTHKYEEAERLLNMAIKIAPDFKEAWSNLGATYGIQSKYEKAYLAYDAAYKIDKCFKNAVLGLVMTCINLHQYFDAMHYCEALEKNCRDKELAESYRARIRQLVEQDHQKDKDAFDLAKKIIEMAYENDYLPSCKFNYIPEIVIEARDTCEKIFSEFNKSMPDAHTITLLEWASYAGIGLVFHWHKDWPALKKKGFVQTLLGPKGLEDMDEYVIETIGLEYAASDYFNLQSKLHILGVNAYNFSKSIIKDENPRDIIIKIMLAMFLFGMVYEMNQLGYR